MEREKLKLNEQLYIRTYINNYTCSKGCKRKTNGPAWPQKECMAKEAYLDWGLGKASQKKIFMPGSQNEYEDETKRRGEKSMKKCTCIISILNFHKIPMLITINLILQMRKLMFGEITVPEVIQSTEPIENQISQTLEPLFTVSWAGDLSAVSSCLNCCL